MLCTRRARVAVDTDYGGGGGEFFRTDMIPVREPPKYYYSYRRNRGNPVKHTIDRYLNETRYRET